MIKGKRPPFAYKLSELMRGLHYKSGHSQTGADRTIAKIVRAWKATSPYRRSSKQAVQTRYDLLNDLPMGYIINIVESYQDVIPLPLRKIGIQGNEIRAALFGDAQKKIDMYKRKLAEAEFELQIENAPGPGSIAFLDEYIRELEDFQMKLREKLSQ